MAKALKFKQLNVPKQQGEIARFKVVQGPDYGTVFVMTAPRASIGRGDENDIVISDLKASRTHAEISNTVLGWQIRDKGSANGIVIGGKSVREAIVKSGNVMMIGETTLEFVSLESGTQMLVAPPKSMLQVQSEQAALAARKASIQALGQTGVRGMPSGEGLFQNKKVLGIVGGAVALLLVFGNDDKPKGPKKEAVRRDLSSYLPPAEESGPTSKAAEVFFRGGFREFREKNYLRAKLQFETVLQMVPGHRLATIYLENCNKAIEDEVRFHMERGKKGAKAGKLKEAKAHYEAVLRLLYRDQASPSFIEAKDQLAQISKDLIGLPDGKTPDQAATDEAGGGR